MAKTQPRKKTVAQTITANPMWGGHFSTGPAAIMAEINCSVDIDQRLYAHDIKASKAHAAMLCRQGIISTKDGKDIARGLDQILKEIETGQFQFKRELEDVHMNIEARLKDIIGEAAGRLHTARSRNDQVATDFRLWLRDALAALDERIQDMQSALLDQATVHAATVMPGYTHLQAAQPVTFGHHLMAYVDMLGRDRDRLADCARRTNEMPLGSAALAGTSFPIDRISVAKDLGFARPMQNSMDAVSARDFAMEFLAAATILGTHLSRLAEEITLWVSSGFRFITLSEAFTSGSSIMPQKRNPDAAELVRAKVGKLMGSFVCLGTIIKALPLTYAKDMQDDKEQVFDAVDTLCLTLPAMAGMVRDMRVNQDAMQDALQHGFITATDLADWLVRKANIPFRQAHHITGRAVRKAEEKGCRLDQLSLKELQTVDPRISQEVFDVLTPEAAVASRSSLGGTAPKRVREAIKTARKKYGIY